MRKAVFLGVLALAWPCLVLAQKAVITHESMWMMKRVGAPVASPDGRWVVFTVSEPSYDEKEQRSDLWLMPADGSAEPRRLTFTKAGEAGVTWSPDSRRIAFTAKREGDDAAQVYVLDMQGGEAVRVTNLSTGASAPKWSPDGKRILFNSSVYPGAADDEANRKAAAERKARKTSARVYDSFPIRYWDKWLDDLRPHLFVQDAAPGAKAVDILANTKLAKEPGFAGTETLSGQELVAAWSPDGASIVFAATRERNVAAYKEVDIHLYATTPAGGEPRQLTSGAGQYRKPVFAPGGKALYATYSASGEKIYYCDRIAMFGWPEVGKPKLITAGIDKSVDNYVFSKDGKRMFFLSEDAGLMRIYEMPATGGAATPFVEQNSGVYGSLNATAEGLILTWESSVNPTEIARVDFAGKQRRMLTSFAKAAAEAIDWQPPRHFWFTSKRGKKIHSMLILPPAFDANKKYPLLVLMHGGPASMWRDQITLRWNYHLLASPGYVLVLTDYTGSTGYGEKFAQDIQFDPLKGPGDEINEAADQAIRQFKFIDGTHQAAAGASYGGHLANWMEATTTRYRCLVSHAGLVNLESQWGTSDSIYHREKNAGGPPWEQGKVWREQNPIRFAANFKTPILVSVGENDFRVPLNQSIENWSALQRMRVPSRLIVFPDENHWVLKAENSKFWYQQVQTWLAKYLKAE